MKVHIGISVWDIRFMWPVAYKLKQTGFEITAPTRILVYEDWRGDLVILVQLLGFGLQICKES